MDNKQEEIALENLVRKVTKIPQKSREEILGLTLGVKRRTGFYIRVSTMTKEQDTSQETQREHALKKIENDPTLELVDIYADEVSGTTVTHRKGFLKMIADCEAKKIDVIYTKSISRFARNLADLLKYTRRLKGLNIEVIFEQDGFSTFGETGDILLKVLGIVAEFESKIKSDAITTAVDWRYEQEQFMVNRMYGFNKVGKRELSINEEEARVVAVCFTMAIYGYSFDSIANLLNERGVKCLKGGLWSAGRIKSLLSNEKYCGDLLARKTITPDVMTHKQKKNMGQKPQYLVENHHKGIVPKLADSVAKRIVNNRIGVRSTGIPQLKSIDEGALQGFVIVNQNYSGFTYEEYIEASDKTSPSENLVVLAQRMGYFDLRKWEAVSPLLFDNISNKPHCKIKEGYIWFNATAVREMAAEFVEVLFHPRERVIAVRPSISSKEEAVCIAKVKDGRLVPQKVRLTDFFAEVYSESKIKPAHTIRCFGEHRIRRIESKRTKTDEWVMFFDLREIEICTGGEVAVPKRLATAYGSEYYEKFTVCGINQIDIKELWEILTEGQSCDSLAGQMIDLVPFCEQTIKDFGLDITPIHPITSLKNINEEVDYDGRRKQA